MLGLSKYALFSKRKMTILWQRVILKLGLSSLLLVITLPALAGNGEPLGSEPQCYSFLKYGDVWVSCNGRADRITRHRNLGSFGISQDAKTFAFEREFGRNEQYKTTLTVVSLEDGRITGPTALRFPSGVGTECGVVFARSGDSYFYIPEGSGPPDLSPYKYAQCSPDRKTIVGFSKKGKELWVGLPPARVLAKDVWLFSLSPNGRYVGYLTTDNKFCVMQITGVPQCFTSRYDHSGAALPWYLSVSDSSGVIFDMSTDQGCFYTTMYNFSPPKRRGEVATDACVGVAHWQPGMAGYKIVEPIGRSPRWITSEQASALRKWAQREKPSRKRTSR